MSRRPAYSPALYQIQSAMAKLLVSFRCQVKIRKGQAGETAWCYGCSRGWANFVGGGEFLKMRWSAERLGRWRGNSQCKGCCSLQYNTIKLSFDIALLTLKFRSALTRFGGADAVSIAEQLRAKNLLKAHTQ